MEITKNLIMKYGWYSQGKSERITSYSDRYTLVRMRIVSHCVDENLCNDTTKINSLHFQ